jgi:hypothetical protein
MDNSTRLAEDSARLLLPSIIPANDSASLPHLYGTLENGVHRAHPLSSLIMLLVAVVLPNQPAPQSVSLTHHAGARATKPWLVVAMADANYTRAIVQQMRYGALKCRAFNGPDDKVKDEGNIIKPDSRIAKAFAALNIDNLPNGTLALQL